MLLAIAEEGSFSAAAEKVGMTQSAASQCLKALETSLDVPLVARSTRKVALTDMGRRMLPPLRKALLELDAVLQAVRQQARDAGGTVRIVRRPPAPCSHRNFPKLLGNFQVLKSACSNPPARPL